MQDSCMPYRLDRLDRQLLEALQQDAALPRKQLAERCHISEATCSRRIAALIRNGYIMRSTVLLDRRKLGLDVAVFVLVALEKEDPAQMKRFTDALRKVPWVLSISFISGEYDYMLHLVTPNMQAYHEFTERFMVPEHQVKRYLSLFEMKSLKAHAALPLTVCEE